MQGDVQGVVRVFVARSFRNGVVRSTVLWQAKTEQPRILFRQVVGQPRYYVCAVAGGSTELGIKNVSAVTVFERFPGATARAPGDKVVLQLASIGSTHACWCDSKLLGTLHDSKVAEAAAPAIQTQFGRFVSFENLNLDSLSEAESLKAVSVTPALVR